MKKELEITDVINYLTCELKVEFDNIKFPVKGFLDDVLIIETIPDSIMYVHIKDCKPILRPMSDLVKLITHPNINKGRSFIPAKIIAEMYYTRDVYVQCTHIGKNNICVDLKPANVLDNNRINGYSVPFVPFIMSVLYMLKFDYNDLIGQGLAIDINTLNNL